ncbi:unnamed protein product [Prorocentrum cordatum]|uniref:Condensation domain-containing protein n=1 Tax=Prorocentrum cordatum TaxID=2364126 RepID=A0ABN9Y0P9_9DINO|nr:unnamed protein product [Polarella glacialis]
MPASTELPVARAPADDAGEPVARVAGAPTPMAVSFSEEQMLRAYLECPASTAYHAPLAFWLDGPVAADAAARCLQALVDRHLALKMHFGVSGGGVLQALAEPACAPRVARESVAGPAEALALARALAAEPFRPMEGPPCRAAVLAAAGPEPRLLVALVAHHVAVDMLSLQVLRKEFCQLLAAALGAARALPACGLDRADHAEWQRRAAAAGAFAAPVARRVARLARHAAPQLALPLDKPRPPRFTHAGGEVRGVIPAGVLERAEAAVRACGILATRFDLLLSLFAVVLCRSTGQEQLVIGVPHHGRGRETMHTVGCFINILPVCCSVPAGTRLAQVVASVHEEMVSAQRDAEAPLIEVLAALRAEGLARPDPSRNALYQAVCNMWGDVEDRSWRESASLLPTAFPSRGPRTCDAWAGRSTSSWSSTLPPTAGSRSPAATAGTSSPRPRRAAGCRSCESWPSGWARTPRRTPGRRGRAAPSLLRASPRARAPWARRCGRPSLRCCPAGSSSGTTRPWRTPAWTPRRPPSCTTACPRSRARCCPGPRSSTSRASLASPGRCSSPRGRASLGRCPNGRRAPPTQKAPIRLLPLSHCLYA